VTKDTLPVVNQCVAIPLWSSCCESLADTPFMPTRSSQIILHQIGHTLSRRTPYFISPVCRPRGVAEVARGFSNNSTPAVGAEYVDPTSMQFIPQSANRYRTPKEVRRKSDVGASTDLMDWLSKTSICPDGLDWVDATSMQRLQVCKRM
jgi:hypothetical protein